MTIRPHRPAPDVTRTCELRLHQTSRCHKRSCAPCVFWWCFSCSSVSSCTRWSPRRSRQGRNETTETANVAMQERTITQSELHSRTRPLRAYLSLFQPKTATLKCIAIAPMMIEHVLAGEHAQTAEVHCFLLLTLSNGTVRQSFLHIPVSFDAKDPGSWLDAGWLEFAVFFGIARCAE